MSITLNWYLTPYEVEALIEILIKDVWPDLMVKDWSGRDEGFEQLHLRRVSAQLGSLHIINDHFKEGCYAVVLELDEASRFAAKDLCLLLGPARVETKGFVNHTTGEAIEREFHAPPPRQLSLWARVKGFFK